MNSANVIEIEEPETTETAACCEVRMPAGLLGFEHIKTFRWLQVKNNPSLAFIVIEPLYFAPDYRPDIPQADVDFLGLTSPDDAVVYNIVTLRGPRNATVNLKGPIVINRNTGVAKQVVIANAVEYSVQHPLPVNGAA